MAKTDIRLGSIISFDSEREADIIEFIQDLTAQHKLGRFISYILRLACETPETLQYREKVAPILKEMETLGITPRRDALFKQLATEVHDLKVRVNDIYLMTEKLYTLALAQKALGLEDRSKELAAAQFVLKRQTALLEQKIGSGAIFYMYDSDSMRDMQKKADDILELLIETHGDAFNELKEGIANKVAKDNTTVSETSDSEKNSKNPVNSDSLERLAKAIETLCESGLNVSGLDGVQLVEAGKPWPASDGHPGVDTSIGPESKASKTVKESVEKDVKDSLTDLNDSPFDEPSKAENGNMTLDDFTLDNSLLEMIGDN